MLEEIFKVSLPKKFYIFDRDSQKLFQLVSKQVVINDQLYSLK